jgi:hypothetical protein
MQARPILAKAVLDGAQFLSLVVVNTTLATIAA